MTTVIPTLLHRLLRWEAAQAEIIALTEPRADGRIVNYSWRETGDQARRKAAHLKSLGLPPKSNIAILGRNSAHWIMADLAIRLAGQVSVPLYPSLSAASARHFLEHSEARLLSWTSSTARPTRGSRTAPSRTMQEYK